jgi:hypothetical protein
MKVQSENIIPLMRWQSCAGYFVYLFQKWGSLTLLAVPFLATSTSGRRRERIFKVAATGNIAKNTPPGKIFHEAMRHWLCPEVCYSAFQSGNGIQATVLAAFQRAQTLFPFPILGIDTDNGGEFLNEELVAYCTQEHLTFTRGRPSQKRDQCFVEQKNGAIVRKVGRL